MKVKLCLLVLLLSQVCGRFEARPAADSPLPDSLQARLGSTLAEIEWLLHQLVNILSDMVDGIEQEPSLLQNYHFRQILIQVIKRIDFILEHFENVGTAVLTPNVVSELQRIDCVRIRLANYISQSKKFDDSHCRASSNKPDSQTPTNEQILPLLTKIVSILVQVTQQLEYIKNIIPATGYPNPGTGTTTAAPQPVWTKPPSVSWEDLITDFINSKPVTTPNNGATQTPGIGSTGNWNDLISQVMEGMGGTLTPAVTSATVASTASSASTVWEDVMNDLIGQWTGSMTTSAPGNNMDVQQCVDSILSIINTIQNQLPNGTLATSRPN